jgi:hypothetical protein
MKNSWPSTIMKKALFDLLIGYTPTVHQLTRKTDILTLNQHLSSIEDNRKLPKRPNVKHGNPRLRINLASSPLA